MDRGAWWATVPPGVAKSCKELDMTQRLTLHCLLLEKLLKNFFMNYIFINYLYEEHSVYISIEFYNFVYCLLAQTLTCF